MSTSSRSAATWSASPLRANLVERAEDWPWSSLYCRQSGTAEAKRLLAAWPLARRPGWVEHVNAPQSEAELAALRRSLQRGSPFGDDRWTDTTARRLNLESTLRPRGRPKKARKSS